MVQSLGLTLGVGANDWIVLDSLRKKRNLNDYSGQLIEHAAVQTCLMQAESLLAKTRQWLQQHRPDLLSNQE